LELDTNTSLDHTTAGIASNVYLDAIAATLP